MLVKLSTHLGGGFTELIVVEPGSTVKDLLARFGNPDSLSQHLIRVNRKNAPLTHVLQPGDSVSTTPPALRAAHHTANQLVAAGFAVRRPKRNRSERSATRETKLASRNPLLRLIRESWDAVPADIQKIMHEEMERGLNEDLFSLRSTE